MGKNKTLLLTASDIKKKTERIAYEILENTDENSEIILAGITGSGLKFAEKLMKNLKKFSEAKISICSITVNKSNPISHEAKCSVEPSSFKNKSVIIVDDVANTGRTVFYAQKVFMNVLPKQIQVAVLVDRKHKQFPVAADYVGLSLSTNMQEHVSVEFEDEEAVYLS